MAEDSHGKTQARLPEVAGPQHPIGIEQIVEISPASNQPQEHGSAAAQRPMAGSAGGIMSKIGMINTKGAAWGMILVLLSTFGFSTMALLVALIRVYPSFEQVCIRFWSQAAATVLVIVIVKRRELRNSETWLGTKKNRRLLMIRGLWGAGGVSAYYYTLQAIHLSDATALMFLNIPLTAVLARLILREPYTWVDGVTAILSMAGVVLVAQPSMIFGSSGSAAVPWLALLVSLFGAVSAALAYVTIRQIGKGESSLVVVLYFAAIGSIAGPIGLLISGQPFVINASAGEALAATAMGALAFIGQLLLNTGIQQAPAGPASVMRYADVVFSIVFQSTIFGVVPGPLKLVGCLLIMSCVTAVYWKTKRKTGTSPAVERQPLGTASQPQDGASITHRLRHSKSMVVRTSRAASLPPLELAHTPAVVEERAIEMVSVPADMWHHDDGARDGEKDDARLI